MSSCLSLFHRDQLGNDADHSLTLFSCRWSSQSQGILRSQVSSLRSSRRSRRLVRPSSSFLSFPHRIELQLRTHRTDIHFLLILSLFQRSHRLLPNLARSSSHHRTRHRRNLDGRQSIRRSIRDCLRDHYSRNHHQLRSARYQHRCCRRRILLDVQEWTFPRGTCESKLVLPSPSRDVELLEYLTSLSLTFASGLGFCWSSPRTCLLPERRSSRSHRREPLPRTTRSIFLPQGTSLPRSSSSSRSR